MPEPRRRPAVPDDQRAAQRTTLGPVHRTRLTDDVAARLVAGIIDADSSSASACLPNATLPATWTLAVRRCEKRS